VHIEILYSAGSIFLH